MGEPEYQDPQYDSESASARIDRIVNAVSNTELGEFLIAFGVNFNVHVNLMDKMDMAGYFQPPLEGEPMIYLNDELDDGTLIAALAHELRHFEQTVSLPAYPHQYAPREAIWLNRIMEADASAISNGVAYEIYMRMSDKSALEGLDAYEEDDIRYAFCDVMCKNGTEIDALRAAFQQWFAKTERVYHYDNSLIEQYHSLAKNPLVQIFHACATHKVDMNTLQDIGYTKNAINYLRDWNISDIFSLESVLGQNPHIKKDLTRLEACTL